MLDTIINLLNKKYTNLEIVSIYKTGSQLICDNCNDYDYIVIVKELDKNVKSFFDSKTKLNIIIYSKEYYEKLRNFENVDRRLLYTIEELFKPQSVIYGENSVNIKLLENMLIYKDTVKTYYNNIFSKNSKNFDKATCGKHLWWAILSLMMAENNSYEITEQMLDVAKKCHDGELSDYWEEWVKERLYATHGETSL